MQYEQYQSTDRAWSNLLMVLGQYEANADVKTITDFREACNRAKTSLFNLASTLSTQGKSSQARNIFSMVQTINSREAEICTLQSSIDQSILAPSKFNFFGTFLDSINKGDKIKSFRTEVSNFQSHCNDICLVCFCAWGAEIYFQHNNGLTLMSRRVPRRQRSCGPTIDLTIRAQATRDRATA